MRGLIGGMMSGGLVSVLALSVASVVSEQPAGVTPPETPLVEAPEASDVTLGDETPVAIEEGGSTPVGSVTIEEPMAPDLPEGEASVEEPQAPSDVAPEEGAPRADTDPLDEPDVTAIEGAMASPDTPESGSIIAEPEAPVLPNPQSVAPQTPDSEADVTVSTAPAQPIVVAEPEADAVTEPDAERDVEATVVVDEPEGEPEIAAEAEGDAPPETGAEPEDFFVVDLGADGTEAQEDAPADAAEDLALAEPEAEQPRLQLQGSENSLLSDHDTGVTVRRPGSDTVAEEPEGDVAAAPTSVNALVDYAAAAGDTGDTPLMSIVLIDDGSMSAASAALAGLPFSVTIALDPAMPGVDALMQSYRSAGFEIAVMAKLPEGAQPSDVEVTLQSVFQTLPESVAVLDVGEGGLQLDRAVTEQAMEVLAAQGRGLITASQGLNMAGRAAEQKGVPAAIVFRDLDSEDQDARVVRRFVDQAAFRARQESGVVLVGRVRPDTISALILWGTANSDAQVALVPVSAVLNAQ